jgi:hypothetical protein
MIEHSFQALTKVLNATFVASVGSGMGSLAAELMIFLMVIKFL